MLDGLASFDGAMMVAFGRFSFLVAREKSLLVGEGRVLYSTPSITLGKDRMHFGVGLGLGLRFDLVVCAVCVWYVWSLFFFPSTSQ